MRGDALVSVRKQESVTGRYGVSVLKRCRVLVVSAKYKDLQYLCKTKVIPEQFHHFYNNLEDSSRAADKLQEPDVEEDSDTDDETDTNFPAFTDSVPSHQAIGFEPASTSNDNDNQESSDQSESRSTECQTACSSRR